jgi:26S proteasome regulatory subunit N2
VPDQTRTAPDWFASAQMPKLEIKSDVKPSMYAYPAMLTVDKKKKAKSVAKAVLSTAGKKAKHAKKDADTEPEPEPAKEMEVEEKEGAKEEKDAQKVEKEVEPDMQMLPNPARVTLDQEKAIVWEDARYRPITPVRSRLPMHALRLARRADIRTHMRTCRRRGGC